MQTDFFILQDTSNSFLMNCTGETGISGHVSGSLKGPNTTKQEEMEFLSTLIGIAQDHDFSKAGGSLILPDLVLGEDISENTRLINLKKLPEDETPELGVDVAPTDSGQAGKENANSNEGINVSSFIEGQEKDGQKVRYPIQVADQTMQKSFGDDASKVSSVFTSTEEDALSLKNPIQSVNFTTQKADGAPCSISAGEGARPDSGSGNALTCSDQIGSGIENDNTNSNKIIKLSTNFDRPENNASFELKNVVKPLTPEIEKASIHREDKGVEKELLLKLQMDSKHLSEEAGIRVIRAGQNRASGNVNQAAPPHNLSTKSQESDEVTKHLSKELPFEEISDKSKPGFQDMGALDRRTGFFHKDLAGAKPDVMGVQTRESSLSFLNSQPQERSPEIISPSKDTDFFQKPLQTEIIKQVVDRAAMNLNSGRTVIKINLKPESLGHLRLQITTENHQVMLKIMTEVPFVKEIIENNINQLKAALHVHGLQIDDFDVFVAHDSDQHGGRYENAKFSSMGNGAIEEDMDDILPEEEQGTQLSAEVSGENLIDFFA
jgi:flagellar hook-length control protein FliK